MSAIDQLNGSTHWVLQGKGGCGKSLKASVLAQYVRYCGGEPVCGDTDPVNSTLHQIKDLNAVLIPITEGGTVVQRMFDPLFETIITVEGVSVIDNGASTFLPIIKFISSNSILQIMQDSGKQVYIHTVVTGGQAKDDTVSGLLSLLELVKRSGTNAKVVVWVNEFWGIPEFNGRAVVDMPWFTDNKSVIQGVVTIVDRNSDAFATDIRLMTENHLTLREVQGSEDFGVLAKSRIKRVFTDIFDDLDKVFDVNREV